MKTKLTDQIKAVQQVKTFLEVITRLHEDNDLIGLNRFILKVSRELPELIEPLDGVGSTLNSLKAASAVVYSFGKNEETKQITVDAAANFFIELNALEYVKTEAKQY
jgi:hypothetical protein